MLTTFGQGGAGLFVAPTVLEKEVIRQFGVVVVGRLDAVRERYYAISVERRLKHPAVIAISQAANEMLMPKTRALVSARPPMPGTIIGTRRWYSLIEEPCSASKGQCSSQLRMDDH